MDNYVQVLKESLLKKEGLLENILKLSGEQEKLIGEKFDAEAFDKLVDEKDKLIDEILKLDEGFESVYSKVAEELRDSKDEHADDILRMKELISSITEKTVSIQAVEGRNKQKLNDFFQKERKKISESKRSSAVAFNYYKSMGYGNTASNSILDQKK